MQTGWFKEVRVLRGAPIRSRIHQGAAADVARHAGATEGAEFISWRWRGQDHGELWELGVGLFRLTLRRP